MLFKINQLLLNEMLDIQPEDIVARMRFDNPWWVSGQLPKPYATFEARDYFAPFAMLATAKDPHRSVVLMGPRRVGKTVMLYQLIAQSIKSGVPPHNHFFCSLDTPIYARQPLDKIVQLYLKELAPDTNHQILIIFDEIQYLRGWEQELKSLTDSRREIRFVASGSAAAALKAGSHESGAGRFTDFVLPPLTFAEFLRMTGKESSLITQSSADQYQSKDITALNREFVNYLNFGSYPELALSQAAQMDAGRFIKADILDKVLLRDLPSTYGISDTTELYNLFNVLAFNTANEITLEKLSQGSQVSKNTLRRYLDYLEAAYLIKIVERIDQNLKNFIRATSFKVYLSNPSLRAALFGPLHEDDPKFGFVAETAVFSQWMHSPEFKRNLRYARWNDEEVDLVYMNSVSMKPALALEVKWSDRHVVHSRDLEGLITFGRKNNENVTLSATTRSASGQLRVGDLTINLLPTSLYCYRVGKNVLKNVKAEHGDDQLSLKLEDKN